MKTLENYIKTIGTTVEDLSTWNIIFNDIIESSQAKWDRAIRNYQRYQNFEKGIPIFSREVKSSQKDKANNKINVDKAGKVVKDKIGYFAGIPFHYDMKNDDKKSIDSLDMFLKTNSNKTKDPDLITKMSACGYAGRMFYISNDINIPRFMNLFPWEFEVFRDMSTDEIEAALVVYPLEFVETIEKKVIRRKIEWYDKNNVYFFLETGESSKKWIPDTETESTPVKPHFFKYVPVVEFLNNHERKADFEDGNSIIDSINLTISDWLNENEDFRFAYLKTNASIDTETVRKAKESGVFSLPTSDTGEESVYLDWLIKNVNPEIFEKLITRLNKTFESITGFPDLTDDSKFGGQLSGIAIRMKFLPLEFVCATTEKYLDSGLMEQFKIVSSYVRGFTLDWLNIQIEYPRNIPINELEKVQECVQSKGVVSDKTLLKNHPFVTDVEQELKDLDEQKQANLEMMGSFGLGNQGGETQSNNPEDKNTQNQEVK
jgi:SPP1 family phage portal protein